MLPEKLLAPPAQKAKSHQAASVFAGNAKQMSAAMHAADKAIRKTIFPSQEKDNVKVEF